ncbi:MAG: hypothetical protein AVDCRST_MAG53-2647, partial [uncultured Solirubrobacteraceae bacterium]
WRRSSRRSAWRSGSGWGRRWGSCAAPQTRPSSAPRCSRRSPRRAGVSGCSPAGGRRRGATAARWSPGRCGFPSASSRHRRVAAGPSCARGSGVAPGSSPRRRPERSCWRRPYGGASSA